MKKEWHIYEIKQTSVPYVTGINLIYLDDAEPFTSRKQAEGWISKALPKGSYVILEVIVVED